MSRSLVGSSSSSRVGGFEHQLCDEDAGAFASTQAFDGLVPLL